MALSIVLYRLFRNLTRQEWAALTLSSALIVSPFLITYSTMLYANFAGLLILFTFFAVETDGDFKFKNIWLGFIFGLIFYIHNFSTVSIGLIFGFYYLIKSIFTKNTKILLDGLIVLIVAALVGSVSLSGYIKFVPSKPAIPAVVTKSLQTPTQQATAISLTVPTQPVTLGTEKKLVLDTFKEYTGKYWLLFALIFIPVSLITCRKYLQVHRQVFIIPLAIFIPSFLLSLQPFFHFSFLPERFATLAGLSFYFFYVAVILLPPFKKFLLPMSVIPLFLNFIYSDNLILNKGYRSFTDTEIRVYSEIKPILDKKSVVFISSDHNYWAGYFLDSYTIIPGEHFVTCGQITSPGYFPISNFIFAQLLAEKNQSQAILLVQKLKNMISEKIYLITDDGLSCGHGKILEYMNSVHSLFNKYGWHVYEVI
jgi:uncharacterized membrane protein (UPF0136 family)